MQTQKTMVSNALRNTHRVVIDPENVWTYLPMILVYMVFLAALLIYRIGISLHPWLAPGVVLLLVFVLVILAGAKVDDWWLSNGGTIPTNLLAEDKLKTAERAKRTVELYTPIAIITFWLAYGLFFQAGLEMLVSELISNVASLVVFLLVVVTNTPPLRRKMMVAVTTAILIVGISLFVPGPSSLASLSNVVISIHKITAFSLLYLLTEIGSKLRQSPLRNGYSSSYVRKLIQTAWILFAGRFASLLGWVQIGWVIWILQKQLQRAAFISGRSEKLKIEDPEIGYMSHSQKQQQQPQQSHIPGVQTSAPLRSTTSAPVTPAYTNTPPPPRHYHRQPQQYSNGIIPTSSITTTTTTTTNPPSVGRIVQNVGSIQTSLPNHHHHIQSTAVTTTGLSGRSRHIPRNANSHTPTPSSSSFGQTSRTKKKSNHHRSIAKPGDSPLDQYSNGGF